MRIGLIRDFVKVGKQKILTIYFTGCNNGCDCKFSKYEYGTEWEIDEVVEYVKNRLSVIDGLSLSGGDPLCQPDLKEFLLSLRNEEEMKGLNVSLVACSGFNSVPNNIKTKINVIIDKKHNISYDRVTGKHFVERTHERNIY